MTHESHMSKINPHLQVAWDQTSLGSLLFCPRRYQYEHILNYIPQQEAVELTFGSHYHKALEAYHKAFALGATYQEAQDAACKSALSTTKNWSTFQDRYRNPLTLLRTVLWYTDKWGEFDEAQTVITSSGEPAVELSFRMSIDRITPDGEPYILAGHFDGLIIYGGFGLLIREIKTTKYTLDQSYFAKFSPNIQVTWYYTAAQVVLEEKPRAVLIDAAQVAITFSEYNRQLVHRQPAHVDEFLHEVDDWIAQAERYAENKFWPKNERNCFLCAFKKVCSASPEGRKGYLEADFVKRVWNPLESR